MYFVDIRRNEDGVVHRYTDDLPWEDDYIWSEGNYSCDCNRALFFARAVGEEDENVSCGDSAYSLRCVDADENVLYEDASWETDE